MSSTSVRVPQLGESVREGRIVAHLKKAGELVERDEPLVEVETDKAVYVIESPASGRVGDWACPENTVLPIGALIVEIQPSCETPNPNSSGRLSGLMQRGAPGHSSCVPATIEMSFRWDLLDSARRRLRRESPASSPWAVECIAWSVARTMNSHPRFRMLRDATDVPRPRATVDIGIAVELPDDGLATAVVRDAAALNQGAFFAEARRAIERARRGEPACAPPQIVVSSLAHLGVESAIPVIVQPSVATLFVGAPIPATIGRRSRLALTFDHTVANGAAAARFLREVAVALESQAAR